MTYITDKLEECVEKGIKHGIKNHSVRNIFKATAAEMFENDFGNTNEDQTLRQAFSGSNLDILFDSLQPVSQARWGEEIYIRLKKICDGLEISEAMSNVFIRRYIEQLVNNLSAEYPAEYQTVAIDMMLNKNNQKLSQQTTDATQELCRLLKETLNKLPDNTVEQEDAIPFTVPVNDAQKTWELSGHEVKGIHGPKEEWPQEIRSLTDSWEQERCNYPGWYIMPIQKAYELNTYTRTMGLLNRQKELIEAGAIDLTEALEFTYEYVWRLANSMYPVDVYELRDIYEVWSMLQKRISRNGEVTEQQLEHWYYIGGFLLMQYRHRYEKKKWKRTYQALQNALPKLGQKSEDWAILLWYENVCMLFMEFQLYPVIAEVKTKEIPERFYGIRLQVAGLCAELGEDAEANSMLESLEKDLKSSITAELSESEETGHLSILAACEKLHTLLLSTQLHWARDEESRLKQERQQHKEAYEQYREYFPYTETVYNIEEDLLATQYFKREHDKRAFAPDRESITWSSGPDICREAYYMYQMLTKCGIPMKIKCMLSLSGKTEYYMKEELIRMYPMLGIHMLLRGSSTKHIELIVDNWYLAGGDMDCLMEQLAYIINALEYNVHAFRYHKDWRKQDVYSSLLENGLEMLLRYATRSTGQMQSRLIDLFMQMVQEDCIMEPGKLDEVMYRLFPQIDEPEKAAHLNDLVSLQLPQRDARYSRNTPLDIFSVLQRKEQADIYYQQAKIDEEPIEELLLLLDEGGESRQMAITRLQFLYGHQLLTREQEGAYRDSLWSDVNGETGLPNVQDYYLKAFLYMPYENRGEVVDRIKAVLLQRDFVQEQEEGISIYDNDTEYLDELRLFHQAIDDEEEMWWSPKEQALLLSRLDRLESRLESYLSQVSELGRYTEIRIKEQYHKLQEIKRTLDRSQGKQMAASDMEEVYEQMYDKETFREAVDTCYHRLAHHMLDRQTETACVQHLISQGRALNRDRLPMLLSTLHNLFYVGAIQWKEYELKSLDRLLIQLSREMIYDTCSSEQEVKETIVIRRCSGELAYQIYRYEKEKKMKLTQGVLTWKAICHGDDFNTIRHGWVTE